MLLEIQFLITLSDEFIIFIRFDMLLRNGLIIVVDLDFELGFPLICHAVLEVVDRHGEVCVVASNVQELVGELNKSNARLTLFWLKEL